jgi:hypothetical protein
MLSSLPGNSTPTVIGSRSEDLERDSCNLPIADAVVATACLVKAGLMMIKPIVSPAFFICLKQPIIILCHHIPVI